MSTFTNRTAAAVGVAGLIVAGIAGCSASGSSGPTSSGASISYQVDNSPASVKGARLLIAAFEKANPKDKVSITQRPQGSDGDNYLRTRLATGDADDVVSYNSGSLFQALDPDKNFVDLSDQSWVKKLDKNFKAVVSTSKGVYGTPTGSSFSGGIMYNKKVYAKLGLSIPKTWADFISNSQKIKASGVTPILQTYGDAWSSQLFVLADFANVEAQDPHWATNYTSNKSSAKYVKQPAFEGFQHLAEVRKDGLLNKDYASLTNVAGLKELADGTAAQYPMTTNTIGNVLQSNPSEVNDIGVFPVPAEKASDTRLTIWEPGGLYIPKSSTGVKLTAAKKFVAFANSPKGCALQNEQSAPAGPYVISTCTTPSSAPALIKDEVTWIDADKASPALEFLSPVKGPNLDKIGVQVGSGINTAAEGAKLYDQDVTQQAQQLGLKGW